MACSPGSRKVLNIVDGMGFTGRLRYGAVKITEPGLGLGDPLKDLDLLGRSIELSLLGKLVKPLSGGTGGDRLVAASDLIGDDPEGMMLKVSLEAIGDKRESLFDGQSFQSSSYHHFDGLGTRVSFLRESKVQCLGPDSPGCVGRICLSDFQQCPDL